MEQIRKAMIAGQFYEHNAEALESQIKTCFMEGNGPGRVPVIGKEKKPLTGVIVPHAGLSFSGGIAAHSYAKIAESGFADVFIILGPNHRGIGSGVSVSSSEFWETPLGKIAVDSSIFNKLSGSIIDLDDTAHNQPENSIEVQLPFLQFLGKNKSYSIVPIAIGMQDFQTAEEIGTLLATVIKNDSRTIRIIASSDFSHEGMAYGRMPPPNTNVNDHAKKQDKHAIDHILELDPKGLIETIQTHNISMCGYGPVISLLTAAEKLKSTSPTAELLKYGTSYDVFPDSNACVGYAAFAIQ